jgi:hypothetical protein
VGNEYFFCHEWSGVYGAALRNVWVNTEMESVTGGHYLWKTRDVRQMSLNLHLGNRYRERGRIALFNSRTTSTPGNPYTPLKEDIAQMFGNEIRYCSFLRPGYVTTENAPNGGVETARGKMTRGRGGNPLSPMPGEEAGVGICDGTAHPSTNDPDNPVLDSVPVSTRWNLVANSMFQQCPVGIHIGRRVANTVLSDNTFSDCRVPVRDGGLNTIRSGAKERTAFPDGQAGVKKDEPEK